MGIIPPNTKSKWISPPTQVASLEALEISDDQFGQYLVTRNKLTRYQLFRALQLQDRNPGARIGECAAALGFLPVAQVERLYQDYATVR